MGKDKKSKEVPVSVYVEAKKRYLEQLQQILTPRLYEGFESLYEDALELLENEFEEKRQQSKSILKTFQDALKEIPVWNQDIIEHESERIIEVSNCDYLDDLIDALFRAESKILTSVQTLNKSKSIKVKVPIASHFIHRCYICAAREIFKNPFVFNHFKELTPRDKQNNLREAIFMINEGITNAVRELLPIRDILKSSIHQAEYSGTDSDYSSENSDISETESESEDDESYKKRKHRHRKHKKEDLLSSSSSESESSGSEDSESEEEKNNEEISLQENIIESSKKEEIEENILDEKLVQKIEEDESESEEDNESESDDESDNESEKSLEVNEEKLEPSEALEALEEPEMKKEESSGSIGGFFNNLFNQKEEKTISSDTEEDEEEHKESIHLDQLESIFQPRNDENQQEKEELVEIESVAKPQEEFKQIIFEGNKIPKEYRMKEEEDVQNEEKQEVSHKQESNESMDRLETQSIASSGIIYRNEKKETSKAHGGEFIDLSNLRSKEQKKMKKEVTKFVKPVPTSISKSREDNLNKLIQKQREFYKKHLSPQDNMSVLSGMSNSSLNSKASLLSNESRTKLVDNFLNKNSDSKKSLSYLSSVMQNKKESQINEEDEDSGEEYLSDPELNS